MNEAFLISKEEGRSVRDALTDLSKACDEVWVAAAFFREDQLLKAWRVSRCKLRLVVALAYPTDPSILRKLLAGSSDKVKLKFYHTASFHSKLYLFLKQGVPVAAVVGSSNFTRGGLERNVETNVLVEGRERLQILSEHFKAICKEASVLSEEHIARYETLLDKTRLDRQKVEREEKAFRAVLEHRIEAEQYGAFKKCVDVVVERVKLISEREWRGVPVYLAVDHFWHWVKTVLAKDKAMIVRIQSNPNYRNEVLPKLFHDYAQWDKSGHRHTGEMEGTSRWMQGILGRSRIDGLSRKDARKVFESLHAGRFLIRFDKAEKFIKDNPLHRIRASFRYLLWSPNDIVKRISDLLADDNYKLKGFGSSLVQELIGWVEPEKWPPRNNKADKALELLGYKFK
jgi:GNAT superfamily N-acetyltransferase